MAFIPAHAYNLPNLLTFSRILLIPILVVFMLLPHAWAAWTALAIYIPGAITDYLDGYYARQLNQSSPIGRFLDPIADKLFVGAILFLLVASDRLVGIWVVPALVILMRELFVAGLREALGPKDIVVHVSQLAKWKTACQMTAIGFLIVWPFVSDYEIINLLVKWIGQLGLLAATVLTVKTGYDYAKAGLKHLV